MRAAALVDAEAALAAAGVETPRVDAEWLLAGILGVGRTTVALNAGQALTAADAARFAAAVARRARREPLQRILGWEEFRGLRFRLTPDVLVPRPETELLVEWALALAPSPRGGRRLRAIDVGTGSGCIGCAIAGERRDVAVSAVDVAEETAGVARSNAEALQVEVRVVVGDLVTAFPARSVDLLVANLPYVPEPRLSELATEVVAHEPRRALAGGVDGLSLIRRFVPDAHRVLRPAGVAVLETFGAAQAAAVAGLLADAGFVDVARRRDLSGVTRYVAGRRP